MTTSNRNHLQAIDRNACLSISSLGGSFMQALGANMDIGTQVALSAATRMLRSGKVGGTAEALGGSLRQKPLHFPVSYLQKPILIPKLPTKASTSEDG
jgi:hypothetical protein